MGTTNKLITLKEAASISGYSPDYIGQLIREGKIYGKQVYCNVAWMTTEEAIVDYKQNGKAYKKNSLKNIISSKKRKMALEVDIIRLFFDTFKSALPILIVVILSFSLLISYIFYLITNTNTNTNTEIQNQTYEANQVTF